MASGGEDQSEMRRAIAIARRWLRLMVRVKLRMHLRRRIGMMRGVQMMGVRKMRMVRRIVSVSARPRWGFQAALD
jgi:hypothetical protein